MSRLAVVLGLFTAGVFGLWLSRDGGAAQWLGEAAGAWWPVYALIYVSASVLLVPAFPLMAGAGFLYGPVLGVALVLPANVVSATICFLLGRYLAREWVARRVEASPRLANLDRAIQQGGFRLVLCLRLSPMFPFGLFNYAVGLSNVRYRDFLAGCFLATIPGTVVYVYFGSLALQASQVARGAPAHSLGSVWFMALLAVTMILVVLAARILRRQLLQNELAVAEDRRVQPTRDQ